MEVSVVEALLGIIGGLNMILLGWLKMGQNKLSERIDDKVDHKDFSETKQYLERVLNEVIGLKVEIAKWQGRHEAQATNSERY